MSTTQAEQGPPIPPGYKPGDYVPFADRDPSNPSSIAGEWADPARQAQMHGQVAGRALTPQEQYRAIYGDDAPERIEFASWGRRVLGYLVDTFLLVVASIPFYLGFLALDDELEYETDCSATRRSPTAPTSATPPSRSWSSADSSHWASGSTTSSSGRGAPATPSARRSWESG